MISNNKLDIFKRSISIVTKTIGKKKETEINFVTEESNIEGNYVNLKEPQKDLSKKNISETRGEADSIGSQICYHNESIHKKT